MLILEAIAENVSVNPSERANKKKPKKFNVFEYVLYSALYELVIVNVVARKLPAQGAFQKQLRIGLVQVLNEDLEAFFGV